MSFSSLGYAERFAINTPDGPMTSVLEVFERQGERYYNFTGADYFDFHFQLHPQTDPYTRPLIVDLCDYDNGMHLSMEYFSVLNGDTYVITHKIGLKDDHGEWIAPISYTDEQHQSHTVYLGATTGTTQIPALMAPTLDSIPIRYFYANTYYYSDTTMTAGTPAYDLTIPGRFWYRRDILGDITSMTGKVNWGDVTNHLTGFSPSCFQIYSDEDLEALNQGLADAGNGKKPYGTYDPDKPPFENDPSGTGGGHGGYKPSGETSGVPGLPTVSAIGSGFLSIYNPSSAQLRSLAAKLWTDDFYNTILKLWNDPLEGLISFNMIPFAPTTSGSDSVTIGNYDTEVNMPIVSQQYYSIECGSVLVEEYWGSALDYEPYTKTEIFLPFVGIRSIDTDEIMNKTVTVKYNCDILNGSAVCLVIADDNVLYAYNCNILTSVPITGSNFSALWGSILDSAVKASVGAAVGGGMGAIAGGLASAANTVSAKHSSVEKGGGISSSAGMLGAFIPYLIIHRPVQSLPNNFGHFKGYPSNVTMPLSSLSGYTEVEYIHLDGISATDAEKEEIYALLKAGVIL